MQFENIYQKSNQNCVYNGSHYGYSDAPKLDVTNLEIQILNTGHFSDSYNDEYAYGRDYDQ